MAVFSRQRLQHEMSNLIERSRDRQLRLAVTGLSRSGKTAFLSSLINQLRHAGVEARLDLLPAAREGRLLGARRVNQPDLEVPRFPYDQALKALGNTPPRWPSPTKGISELRLSLRFRPRRSTMLKAPTSTLTLDLIDYPGEWLLDLPLLQHDYDSWCRAQAAHRGEHREAFMAPFQDAVARLDPAAEACEDALAEIAERYAMGLKQAREAGFSNLQPGRFLLPGELAGAPVLQFFPLNLSKAEQQSCRQLPDTSVYATLAARFEHYRKQVVTPFYRDHFQRFDRQIVLVDLLGALNAGPERFEDLSAALAQLMQSFNYGKRHLLNRLFDSRIDRLAVAATKADHVTPDQHERLVKLLETLLAEPLKDLRYTNVPVKAFSLAAIRATDVREVHDAQGPSLALSGHSLGGKACLFFPGDVPTSLPDADFWAHQGFNFASFRPRPMTSTALDHIRMDSALDWLLGDKLQ